MTDHTYDLERKDVEGKNIVFVEGDGQRNIENPGQPVSFEGVRDQLFPALREEGKLGYGPQSKWDDRKYRLNAPDVGDEMVVVPVGLTYFGAARADIGRSDDENVKLQEYGEEVFNDRWAFFARPFGVAVVPVTKDGSTFVGVRENTSLYQGWLNAAAGNADFAGSPSFGNFFEQALGELKSEYGISQEDIISSDFVGVASHRLKGDSDATWLVRVNVGDAYFESGRWAEQRSDAEHGELVRIATPAERDQLLGESNLHGRGFPGVMYSTALGLESMTAEHFRRLE